MFKCDNCGGDLVFEPQTQSLMCQQCGSHFPLTTERDKEVEQAEDGTYETEVFTCPNCGGQLIGITESIVDFCPYCGTQVQTKTEKIRKQMPEAIVPFSVTRDQCKTIYKRGVGKYIFAPAEMRSDKFIDRVQGVYVPYWSYFCDVNGPVRCECESSDRTGNYIIHRYYDVSAEVHGQAIVSYDASRELDDSISKMAGGFADQSIRRFSPQYLSGFYADLPDVPYDEHLNDAGATIKHASVNKFLVDTGRAIVHTDDRGLQVNVTPRRTAMPMYFLTWRDSEKVAYSLVNGQNGKLSAKLPIDFKKYFIVSLCIAIPLFLAFLFMPFTIMPSHVAIWSGFILMFAMLSAVITGKKALDSEKNIFGIDQGGGRLHPDNPMTGTGYVFIAVFCCALLAVLGTVLVNVSPDTTLGLHSLVAIQAVSILFGIILFFMALAFSGSALFMGRKHPEGWFGKIGAGLQLSGFPALIGILLSSGLTFIDLVQDEFYYAIAVYTMFIAILIFINVISEFNYAVTRPQKYFERRKGLRDRA